MTLPSFDGFSVSFPWNLRQEWYSVISSLYGASCQVICECPVCCKVEQDYWDRWMGTPDSCRRGDVSVKCGGRKAVLVFGEECLFTFGVVLAHLPCYIRSLSCVCGVAPHTCSPTMVCWLFWWSVLVLRFNNHALELKSNCFSKLRFYQAII